MPARSKAQLGMMFHLENIGEVPAGTGRHWARETKKLKGGIQGLPERVTKKAVLRNRDAEGAREFVGDLFKSAAGIAASDPALALTGGMSAVVAPETGNRMEAYGRGLGLYGGGYAGGHLGAALGSAGSRAAGLTDPRMQTLATVLGSLGGVYGGYKGMQALMGPSSWADGQKPQTPSPERRSGIAGSDPVLALTGGASAPFATHTGNRPEAYGRGNLLSGGALTGAALGTLGGGLGAIAGGVTDPRVAGAILALSGLGGGYAGYKGMQTLSGEPSWSKEKATAQDDGKKKEERKAASARKFAENLFGGPASGGGTSTDSGPSKAIGGAISSGGGLGRVPATKAPLGGVPSAPIAPKTNITATTQPMMNMAATVGS